MLLRVLAAAPGLGNLDPLLQRVENLDVSVHTMPDGADLDDWLSGEVADVLVLDHEMLGDSPERRLEELRSAPDPPSIVVLVDSDEVDATERARLHAAGANIVLVRDVDIEPLAGAVEALVVRRQLQSEHAFKASQLADESRLADFASESPSMKRFLKLVRKVVDADTSLLVTGETGVGKEYLSRAIHRESRRASGPFVAVSCGAIAETLLESELFGHERGAFTGAHRRHRGHFEMAHRGTLLLDEVGEMPAHLQSKLLRVLQEREIQPVGSESSIAVDVRVIAATNRDLKAEVQAKRFRSDLYYRLAVVTLEVPPLRDRREDLARLAQSHVDHFAGVLRKPVVGIRPEVIDVFLRYRWPGNVREMINVVERAVLLTEGEEITLTDLPADMTAEATVRDAALREPVSESLLDRPWREARDEVLLTFERSYLERLLSGTGGSVGQAAELAGLSPRSLYDALRRCGLRKEDFKGTRA